MTILLLKTTVVDKVNNILFINLLVYYYYSFPNNYCFVTFTLVTIKLILNMIHVK